MRRAITRDPERYPDPHTFRPERFLPLFDPAASPAEKEGILDPRTYAFGYGRRYAPPPPSFISLFRSQCHRVLTQYGAC